MSLTYVVDNRRRLKLERIQAAETRNALGDLITDYELDAREFESMMDLPQQHLKDHEIEDFVAGRMDDLEFWENDSHLSGCISCYERVLRAERFRAVRRQRIRRENDQFWE